MHSAWKKANEIQPLHCTAITHSVEQFKLFMWNGLMRVVYLQLSINKQANKIFKFVLVLKSQMVFSFSFIAFETTNL